MSRFAVLAAGLAALAGAPHAAAQPADPEETRVRTTAVLQARPVRDARSIVAGLRRAVADGRLTRAEAAHYRLILARARAVLTLLPGVRYTTLARVLALVRQQARAYNRPRALTLFRMLERNTTYLSTRGVPPQRTDVYGGDGALYRSWGSYGLQFHPLANAGALSKHLAAHRDRRAAALANALVARLVPRRRGAVLEYLFPYAGGTPPWTSGMAQAALAHGLALAARRFDDPSLRQAARRAYRAIPGRLVFRVSAGPWIRLYDFNHLVVLNAQLQAALSIARYAEATRDASAAALAVRLRRAARALFHRFDTGYWSRYALGSEAPLRYHLYHIYLLDRLWIRTRDPFWRDARDRFDRYRREAPVLRRGRAVPTLYPWPADGFRDEARIAVWVSKVSTVTVRVARDRRTFTAPAGGWYSFAWRPGRRPPAIHRPVASAVDLAGNRAQVQLPPIAIAVDRDPPSVTASVVRRRLTWRAVDAGTPWLRMTVRLERAGRRRSLSLGRQPLAGSLTLPVPRGRWHAVLVASDSSGNRTRVGLGVVPAL
ncbi:MAG: D-glucuronyl C5-epimerase family protein [Actinomycetota bacterium]|nr:D-glucuronyl C5-epimerase family protein [Actinomycetota bacterium]